MAVGDNANSLRNNKSKRDVLIVRISLIVLGIILIGLPALPYLFAPESDLDRVKILEYRGLMIQEALMRGAEEYDDKDNLYRGIELIEQEFEDGQPYYIGEIKPELDEKLPEYVKQYNADPSTEYPVTEEEVRFGLTEGLYETINTGENEASQRLRLFFNWCNGKIKSGDI